MTDVYGSLIDQGVSTRDASVLTGLVRSTAHRHRQAAASPTPAITTVPPIEPVNKLTLLERRRILEVLGSRRFVDLAPLQVYAQLLDEDVYLCSVSTMYRVLREHAQVKERRRLARHPAKACPELVATGTRQVYSWDITKLAGPVKGTYFDAYVMIDIYSRYMVGVHVHAHESGLLAKEMMEQIFAVHGIPDVVHADRGTSMTSKTVATLLADLEVTRSHSRPRVSNDNPYSESLFKTLKYGPEFPERFGSISEARTFMDSFAQWYNHEHRHTSLGLHTPADVHYGHAPDKDTHRRAVLAEARTRHPHRFGPITAPKILDLPDTVWINKPATDPNNRDDTQTTAA
jgi:putative transposase